MAGEATWEWLENAVCDKVSTGNVMCLDMVDQVTMDIGAFLCNFRFISEGIREPYVTNETEVSLSTVGNVAVRRELTTCLKA